MLFQKPASAVLLYVAICMKKFSSQRIQKKRKSAS